MDCPVRCAFCRALASRYFITLDNTLWTVCPRDSFPFVEVAVELDPETYDLESYFARLQQWEPRTG
jgi:hypothetical protein